MKKTALITGITGQDGSYLAELLLAKGYTVHGLVRKHTLDEPSKLENISKIKENVRLHEVNLEHSLTLQKLVKTIQPDECYHFAAPSFVSYSLDDEFLNFSNGFQFTHSLFAALREAAPQCRAFLAGSSEMFGSANTSPQNEQTQFRPRSLYGISKLSSYHLVRNYRELQKMFVAVGILYNHESPRRGHNFVTRKITFSAARIKLGLQDKLALGNLEADRDWGYAPEYVEAMWRMLQVDEPTDFVLSTGKTHTVREFVKSAFDAVGLDYSKYVVQDERFFRPSEQIKLVGDASKAKKLLGWEAKTPLANIVHEMVQSDLKKLSGDSR